MLHTHEHRPASRLHADRVAGGDRHHRHPDRPAPAGRAEGPRGRGTDQVRQQPQAARPGRSQLPRRSTSICRLASGIIRHRRTASSARTSSTCCRISNKATSFEMPYDVVPFPSPVGPTAVYYSGQQQRLQPAVATFLCPSDPSIGSDGVVAINGTSFGASSYGPNALIVGKADLTTKPYTVNPQGKARIPSDFTDGTSNTILHAEKYGRCTNTSMAPQFQDGGTAWAYSAAAPFPWQPPPMTPPFKPFQPGFAFLAWRTRAHPMPLVPRRDFSSSPHPNNCDPTRAATAHPAACWLAWPTAASARWPRAERRHLVGRRDARVAKCSVRIGRNSGVRKYDSEAGNDLMEFLTSDFRKQSGRWGPYRQASPPPARHRPAHGSCAGNDVSPWYRRLNGEVHDLP